MAPIAISTPPPTSLKAPPSQFPNPTPVSSSSLDAPTLSYMKTLSLGHFRSATHPWRSMGPYKYRILEDGSLTQDRLSIVESLILPKSHGPIFHFHEMHDETFYVTAGKIRFHSPGRKPMDAEVGDLIVVPTRMPHRFSNPFGEEAKFVSTNTPSHYARYFHLLEELIGGEGKQLTPEINKAAMKRFATVPLEEEDLRVLERELAVDDHGEGESEGKEANGVNGTNGHSHEKEGGEGWNILD